MERSKCDGRTLICDRASLFCGPTAVGLCCSSAFFFGRAHGPLPPPPSLPPTTHPLQCRFPRYRTCRREGKFGHAAHFTVRCGCIVDPGGSDADGHKAAEVRSYVLYTCCRVGGGAGGEVQQGGGGGYSRFACLHRQSSFRICFWFCQRQLLSQ